MSPSERMPNSPPPPGSGEPEEDELHNKDLAEEEALRKSAEKTGEVVEQTAEGGGGEKESPPEALQGALTEAGAEKASETPNRADQSASAEGRAAAEEERREAEARKIRARDVMLNLPVVKALVGKRRVQQSQERMTEEEQRERIMTSFESTFGIKKEELKSIEGFERLSPGQQALVLENLGQLTLGRIKEEALARVLKETTEANFLSRVWRGLFKKVYVAAAEKKTAEEILSGGIKTHGEVIQALVKRIESNGPDVVIKENGEFELRYLRFAGINPEEEATISAFNDIAAKLSRLPYEWSLPRAERKKRSEYKNTLAAYEKAKREIINLLERRNGAAYAVATMSDIDRKVRFNQFLNTHPEAEEEIKRIQSSWVWFNALKSVAAERGSYMGFGFVARTVTASLLGMMAIPLTAAGIGGWIARKRAIEGIREEERLGRSGKKPTDAELFKFTDAEVLNKRITHFLDQLNAAKTPEEKQEILGKLGRRVDYIHRQLRQGRINFGSQKERLANQYTLFQKLSEAEIALSGLANKEVNQKLQKRLDNILAREEEREQRIKKSVRDQMIRGAVMAAGFALLGYAIREFFFSGGSSVPVEQDLKPTIQAPQEHVFQTAGLGAGHASFVEVVGKGDSVWKLAEEQLRKHFGEAFTKLNEGQRTYLIDAIKDKIVADPEKYGLVGIKDVDNLPIGARIDFSRIFQNKDWMETIFGKAGVLTEDQVAAIVHNNAILREWVINHPHERLTSDKVAEILSGRGKAGLPPEAAGVKISPQVIEEHKAGIPPAAEHLSRPPLKEVITGPEEGKFFIAPSEHLSGGVLKFTYNPDGSVESMYSSVQLRFFDVNEHLNKNWFDTLQKTLEKRWGVGRFNIQLHREGLTSRVQDLEIQRQILKSLPPDSPEARFVKSAIQQLIEKIKRDYGDVLRSQ